MRLTVNSEDQQLLQLCRELCSNGLAADWELSVSGGHADPCLHHNDLIVWDFNPALDVPPAVEAQAHKHLFLVDRNDLDTFRERFPLASAGILLKPITRATLGAYLEQRVAAFRRGASDGRLGALRADRDEILQSLIVASLKLQEYDQDRTRFLTRAVHDFRAPLTAISGYCGLMLGGGLGFLSTEQKEVLVRMQHSAKRLSRMANGMFQLGVAHKFETAPQLRPGDLRDCVEQVLHEIAHLLDEKDLVVSVDLAPSPCTLFFDGPQIEQLFLNLLDNACRFTPKSGSIDVRGFPFFWDRRLVAMRQHGGAGERRSVSSTAPNAYRVEIRDSGPGIPPGHLDRIFEEYTSYSGGQDRSGGGLGLAICKMIAKRHQGRIWAESSSTGAIFSFVLPFKRDENPNGVPEGKQRE